MTDSKWHSAFIAALFALHPLHVQSVVWVSERKDVLSAFFWMLTIWAYVRYIRRPDRPAYVLVLVFYLLGLMSKPMVVTLPFVLLLLDYWPLNRFQLDGSEKNLLVKIAGLLWEKIPLFILTAASAGITFLVQDKWGAVRSFDIIPLTHRLSNMLISYVQYIIKFLYPIKLGVFYPYPDIIPVRKLVTSIMVLSTVSWAAIKLINRKPWFIVGWLWFLGTLVPVIGIVQVGIQSMADRYMYLPMIGLLILVAWGMPELLSKWHYRKTVLSISAVCILISLLWVSIFQLAFWADTYTLFSRAIAVTENNYLAYNIVGDELGLKGDYDSAEISFLTALAIKPDNAETLDKLGQVAFQKKDYDKALHYYQNALAIHPADREILNMTGKTYYNLGLLSSKQGKINDALNNYKKAISINPDYADAHKSLADVLFSKRDMAQAFKHYSEALRINPDDATTQYNIGVILFQQQQFKAADKHFYQAVQINNSYEKARIALAMTRNILESEKR
jgi:Tfp pilus assembly protein PilF